MRTEYNGLIITGTPIEMAELAKFIMPELEKPKAEPNKDAASKKQTTKKELDMGKIKALRKAGWSFDKIGDEMGVSAQTIANRMKEYEQ